MKQSRRYQNVLIFLDSYLDPIVCVPCTFFIGENGIPLEVVGGHVEPKQLIDKIDVVLQVGAILVLFDIFFKIR